MMMLTFSRLDVSGQLKLRYHNQRIANRKKYESQDHSLNTDASRYNTASDFFYFDDAYRPRLSSIDSTHHRDFTIHCTLLLKSIICLIANESYPLSSEIARRIEDSSTFPQVLPL